MEPADPKNVVLTPIMAALIDITAAPERLQIGAKTTKCFKQWEPSFLTFKLFSYASIAITICNPPAMASHKQTYSHLASIPSSLRLQATATLPYGFSGLSSLW